MIYDPFSIVIVPFPFIDKLQTKRRAALVLSSREHQKEMTHITLVMLPVQSIAVGKVIIRSNICNRQG